MREGTHSRPGHTHAGAPRPPLRALRPSSLSVSELVWPWPGHLDFAEGQFPKMSFGQNQMRLGTVLRATVFYVAASQNREEPHWPHWDPCLG